MSEKKSKKIPLKTYNIRYFPVLIALVMGVLLSVVLYYFVLRWEKNRISTDFDRATDNYMALIKNGSKRAIGILRSIAAFDSSRCEINEHGFKNFNEEFYEFSSCSLLCHSETQLLGWAEIVDHDGRIELENTIENSGTNDFHILEYVEGGEPKIAKERKEYITLLNIQPYDDTNKNLMGLDISTVPSFQDALISARDSGKTTATGWFFPDDKSNTTYSYMLFLPVYKGNTHFYPTVTERKKNIKGFVIGQFKVNDLAERSLDMLDIKGIDIHMYDRKSYEADNRLIYRSRGNISGAHPKLESENLEEGIYETKAFFLGEREWDVIFHKVNKHTYLEKFWESKVFLLIGLILTSILVTYLFISTNESVYIEKLVNERTVELDKSNKELESEIERHKLTGDALLESEENYRNIYNNAQVGLFRIKISDGEVINANATFAEMFGYESAQEAIAEFALYDHYVNPEDFKAMIKTLQKEGEVVNLEVPLTKKDKSLLWVRLWARVYLEKCFIEGVVTDITEERRITEDNLKLQSELLQSQKMDSIGRLAGGIAHDFNNMLTGIIGYTELSLNEIPEDHPIHKKLKVIESSSQKATALTRQLLAFSRKQILDIKVVNLNTIVNNASKLFERVIGDNIKLKLMTKRETANIKADPIQIEQIIMNLVINARDAMKEGGYLTIETRDISENSEEFKKYEGLEKKPYVILSVADTGSGIEADIKNKIFDPFFTTKPKGKGTGLGLSTVFGIVKQHNGYIMVDTEIGNGTTFKVFLPAYHEKIEKAKKEKPTEMDKGTETILVVDDETFVCDLIKDTLDPLGYKVLLAENGDEAMKICYNTKSNIDLLLTDIVMPGPDGKELANAMLKMRPKLKVIYMSGYTDEKIVDHGILKSGVEFIQKPITPKNLSKKVREVLNRD